MKSFIYHVTFTKNVKGIRKYGLKVLQPSLWKLGNGERANPYGGIYAFTSAIDALRWAFKQKFDHGYPTSILQVQRNKGWEIDTNISMSLFTVEGRALVTWKRVPTRFIKKAFPLDTFDSALGLGITTEAWFERAEKLIKEK